MSLIELIGFIITMLMLTFLFGRQVREERKRRKDPEGYERAQKEKEKQLEELIYGHTLEPESEGVIKEEEELEVWEQPAYKVEEAEPAKPKITMEAKKDHPSRAQMAVQSLGRPANMLVLRTLFGPPKSLDEQRWW